jgi:hypothetical protein
MNKHFLLDVAAIALAFVVPFSLMSKLKGGRFVKRKRGLRPAI